MPPRLAEQRIQLPNVHGIRGPSAAQRGVRRNEPQLWKALHLELSAMDSLHLLAPAPMTLPPRTEVLKYESWKLNVLRADGRQPLVCARDFFTMVEKRRCRRSIAEVTGWCDRIDSHCKLTVAPGAHLRWCFPARAFPADVLEKVLWWLPPELPPELRQHATSFRSSPRWRALQRDLQSLTDDAAVRSEGAAAASPQPTVAASQPQQPMPAHKGQEQEHQVVEHQGWVRVDWEQVEERRRIRYLSETQWSEQAERSLANHGKAPGSNASKKFALANGTQWPRSCPVANFIPLGRARSLLFCSRGTLCQPPSVKHVSRTTRPCFLSLSLTKAGVSLRRHPFQTYLVEIATAEHFIPLGRARSLLFCSRGTLC